MFERFDFGPPSQFVLALPLTLTLVHVCSLNLALMYPCTVYMNLRVPCYMQFDVVYQIPNACATCNSSVLLSLCNTKPSPNPNPKPPYFLMLSCAHADQSGTINSYEVCP